MVDRIRSDLQVKSECLPLGKDAIPHGRHYTEISVGMKLIDLLAKKKGVKMLATITRNTRSCQNHIRHCKKQLILTLSQCTQRRWPARTITSN